MAQIKKKLKFIGRYVWEMVKGALPSTVMYMCAGMIMFMLICRKGVEPKDLAWTTANKLWTAVCIVAAAAYNFLIGWANGGNHYEMLVSGNIKRSTADVYGNAYKISSHKVAKEYRVWKGFVFGALTAIFTVVFGIIFGCQQAAIDKQLTVTALIGFLLSGWSLMPFYAMNATANAGISYFLTCLLALIPIAVSGVSYIAGAYARRNKAIRAQELADKAAQAEAQKAKKINYGGLPGTKPKKRK